MKNQPAPSMTFDDRTDPLEGRLHIVFEHARCGPDDVPMRAFRYVPMATHNGAWIVWDRKAKREINGFELQTIAPDLLDREVHYDG